MTDTTQTDATDRALPEPVAERFQVVLGLDEPPATLGDWIDAVTAFLDADGLTIGPDDLCTTGESRHVARFDGDERSRDDADERSSDDADGRSSDDVDGAATDGRRQHYRCVFDALLVPFVHDEPGTVEVRTHSPVSDDVIEATVESGDGAAVESGAEATLERDAAAIDVVPDAPAIDVEPDSAVASLGVATDAPPASELEGSPLEAYELFCPYVNGFADRAEYDAWAAETPEAATTALSFPAALEVARALASVDTDPADDRQN